MKKDKLWKVIFVSLIILIGLSWILPTSSFNDGVFSHTGYEPLGLLDIIFAPFQFFNWDFVGTQLFTDGTTVTAFTYTSILLVVLSSLKKNWSLWKTSQSVSSKPKDEKSWFLDWNCHFLLSFCFFSGGQNISFYFNSFLC